jgi:hypothetical protein
MGENMSLGMLFYRCFRRFLMSSKKLSLLFSSFVTALIASSSHTTFAADPSQNIPQKGNRTNQYASGATSGGSLPHDFFNSPQSAEVRKKPNVPHMMPPQNKKPSKPIPDAPIGHNPSHTTAHNCPPGSQKGWIITEGKQRYMLFEDGTKINLDHSHHDDALAQTETEEERNLKRNPLLTPAEETLRENIEKHGIGSTYDRPGHGPREFGKEYEGKVYFKATPGTKGYKPGLWEADPNVKPLGLAEKKKPTKPFKMVKPASSEGPAKKTEPVKAGAVGLTVRTNTAQTNPQTGRVELQQGKPNVAQTGLTGAKEPPKVDASSSIPTPPPPPPIKKLATDSNSTAATKVDATAP